MTAPAPAPGSPPRKWTLSNGLTSLRLLAAPIHGYAIARESWHLACALFWLAVASDLIDGRLARARGETSAFGGLLDHASDATFVALGLAALALAGRAPGALPLLVAFAFVQYTLDSRALAGRALRTSSLGRWNGILYFVPVGIVVTREAFGLGWPPDAFVRGIGWALVMTTLVSIGERGWRYLSDRGAGPTRS